MAVIYGLFDPRNPIEIEHCRYVGQTIQRSTKRLYQHITDSNAGKPRHVNKWIRSILRENVRPVLSILETIDEDDRDALDAAEIHWIAVAKGLGCNLTNHSVGGGGNRGYTPTAEQRANMGASHIGFKHSDETRAQMSAAATGKLKSLEHRAALSAALTGKPLTLAQIEANTNRRGIPRSPESIVKQSESLRNSPKMKAAGERRRGVPRPESGPKISAANTGNPKVIENAHAGGDAFKRKFESDPEFAAAWVATNQAATAIGRKEMFKKRVQCDECGFISNPQGIGHHQTSFSHTGKTQLDPLPD